MSEEATKEVEKEVEAPQDDGGEEEVDEKLLNELSDRFEKSVDKVMEEKLGEYVSPMVANKVKEELKKRRAEQAVAGNDKYGLSLIDKEEKEDVAQATKEIAKRGFIEKSGLLESDDDLGGWFVPTDTANTILRIAADVGLVVSQAQRWTVPGDSRRIPSYRGSFLEGEFLGEGEEGKSHTSVTFNSALLRLSRWQLPFVLSNDLLADSTVDLSDWLTMMAGEAVSNMTDKQGFKGGDNDGDPFVGLLNDGNVTTYTLNSGTSFDSFDPLVDGSDVPAQLDTNVLDGCAWYFDPTVWAKIRQQTKSNNPVLTSGGIPSNAILENNPTGGGVRPAGELMGYPVFTTKHLPANSDSASDTKYFVFGNFGAGFAWGTRGEMALDRFRSGQFDGKEIARSDETAMVFKRRLGLVNTLPGAFVVGKTGS